MIGRQQTGGKTAKGLPVCTRIQPDDDPALLIVAANPKRISLSIYNHHATVVCFLNEALAGTALTGYPLLPGEEFVDLVTKGAWYGITAASTADLRVVEVSG